MYNKHLKREKKFFELFEILDLFQQSAVEHGIMLGQSHEEMLLKNQFWAILRTKFIVVNNKEVEDIINITYPKKASRLDFDREYVIKSNDDILIKGIAKWVIMDVNTRKLVRNPGVNMEEFAYDDLFSGVDKISIDYNNFELVDKYQVENTDLDKNNHVNNVSYVNMINKVYKNKNVTEFQIDYLHEILPNSLVELFKYESDDTYVLGKCSNQNCFIAKIKGE